MWYPILTYCFSQRVSEVVLFGFKQLLNWDHLVYLYLYNNQINARALIGQSAMVYCASNLMEKSRVFWIVI